MALTSLDMLIGPNSINNYNLIFANKMSFFNAIFGEEDPIPEVKEQPKDKNSRNNGSSSA